MDSSAFSIDPNELEVNLLLNLTGKKSKNQLSVNYLPHLFHYVRSLLTETERKSLKDYDMQVFIIESVVSQKRFSDLTVLCNYIIDEIRGDTRYWIKGTEPFMQVYEHLKAAGKSDENMDSLIRAMNEENEQPMREHKEYFKKVGQILKTDQIQQEPTKEIKDFKSLWPRKSDEIITFKPRIEQNIPSTMNFEFKNYEAAVDSYYADEVHSIKIRTRRQDLRDKKFGGCSQEFMKNYVNIFREVRDNDPNFANSIFVCNRNNKIPRIEIQLFPTIFQFFTKKYDLNPNVKTTEQVFLFQRIQNLIYLCLLTDDKNLVGAQSRVNKAAFTENIPSETMQIERESLGNDDDIEREVFSDGTMEEEFGEYDDDFSLNPFDSEPQNLILDFKLFSKQNGINVDVLFGADFEKKKKKLDLLNNTLRICKIFIEKIHKYELSPIPTLEAQDATFDNFRIRELIAQLDNFDSLSDEVLESIVDFYHLEFEHKNIWQYMENLLQYSSYAIKPRQKGEKGDLEEMQGVFSDRAFCLAAIENYKSYFYSPTVEKKRSYIFHTSHRPKPRLSPEESLKFLEGLLKYLDNPINNRKIAEYIGKDINVNHIKYIKKDYMKMMRKSAKALGMTPTEYLIEQIKTKNIQGVNDACSDLEINPRLNGVRRA